jgi:repressor LexA
MNAPTHLPIHVIEGGHREALTDRQRAILEFVRRSVVKNGFPPTLREIGRHFAIRSTNGVNDHLRALERKGYLERLELKSRTLRPVAAGSGEIVDVPLVGRVAAGTPLLAEENVQDTLRVDRFFLGSQRPREVFALRVTGESMVDDGILDGDYLFVRKQIVANSGDIVVALIDDEATVKRYYPEGDRIRLQPANPRMEPIYVRKRDFRQVSLLGVVVGVYRAVGRAS